MRSRCKTRTDPNTNVTDRRLPGVVNGAGTSSSKSGGRLGLDDWLAAGYAILAEEGIKALKIDRLCDRLGVTKGSFYWHFANMPGYRSALISAWGELRDEDRSAFEALTGLPPRERLIAMMNSLMSPRHWTLERAMREWARTDDEVAASVREADRRVVRAVRQAFIDYGFGEDEAGLRAEVTFATGIGFLHLAASAAGDSGRAERFLELMLAQ